MSNETVDLLMRRLLLAGSEIERAAAGRALQAKCKALGLDPHALHVSPRPQ
jgi:hypothetical protein